LRDFNEQLRGLLVNLQNLDFDIQNRGPVEAIETSGASFACMLSAEFCIALDSRSDDLAG